MRSSRPWCKALCLTKSYRFFRVVLAKDKYVCWKINDKEPATKNYYFLTGNNEVGAQIGPKVVIHKPTPFPYKDSKRVPWNYDCSVTVPEKENIASTSKDVQVEGSHRQSGKRYDTRGIRVEPIKIKCVKFEKEKETEVPINEPVKEGEEGISKVP